VFVIAQFGGYFGSYVYLGAVAPILCWRVDDWLRRGLPEIMRHYADVPDAARRLRRPATVPAASRPGAAAARAHPQAGGAPRVRTGRPTRSPAG
jgi:hypothetical protein